tara:strand:+ start:520 stop:858 length:339 start_codon:yes stop_codon:yes gene_type:complete
MKYLLTFNFLISIAYAEVTQKDILDVINKVDSYDIIPKSLIDHAKQEVKTLKSSDLQQINSTSKMQVPNLPNLPSKGTPKEGVIPDNIKKDLETIKKNAKKRQELLESVMKE